MTQLYLAKWPDGSISLVEAANELELFRELDTQCDPYSASICKINKSERLHLEFEIKQQRDESFIDVEVAEDNEIVSEFKPFDFKKDMFIRYLSEITGISMKALKKSPEYIKEMKSKMNMD
jgi:hypothetical protein